MHLNHRIPLRVRPKVRHNLVSELPSRPNILLYFRQTSTFSSKAPSALLRNCPRYTVQGVQQTRCSPPATPASGWRTHSSSRCGCGKAEQSIRRLCLTLPLRSSYGSVAQKPTPSMSPVTAQKHTIRKESDLLKSGCTHLGPIKIKPALNANHTLASGDQSHCHTRLTAECGLHRFILCDNTRWDNPGLTFALSLPKQ